MKEVLVSVPVITFILIITIIIIHCHYQENKSNCCKPVIKEKYKGEYNKWLGNWKTHNKYGLNITVDKQYIKVYTSHVKTSLGLKYKTPPSIIFPYKEGNNMIVFSIDDSTDFKLTYDNNKIRLYTPSKIIGLEKSLTQLSKRSFVDTKIWTTDKARDKTRLQWSYSIDTYIPNVMSIITVYMDNMIIRQNIAFNTQDGFLTEFDSDGTKHATYVYEESQDIYKVYYSSDPDILS